MQFAQRDDPLAFGLWIGYLVVLAIVAHLSSLYYAIIVVCVCFEATFAQSVTGTTKADRTLDSLRRELQDIENKLAEAEARESDALTALDLIEQQTALQEELVRKQRVQKKLMQDSVAVLTTSIGQNEASLWAMAAQHETWSMNRDAVSKSLGHALLTNRRFGRWAGLELMAGADTWKELVQRRSVVLRLMTYETNAVAMLSRSLDSLEALEAAIQEQTFALSERRKLLASQVEVVAVLEAQLSTDERLLEREQSALKKRLRKVRGSRESLQARQQEIEQAQAAIEELIARVSRGESMAGMPLNLLKGFLPWPVDGAVVVKFGLIKNAELETTTENPGIELEAASDAPVMSIAEGRVSSVTWLRGYGNVCIIEHPGSYYTVYARLGQTEVRADDAVSAGTVLGYPSYDGESGNYRVHFEFWAGRDKKDPLAWLQPR